MVLSRKVTAFLSIGIFFLAQTPVFAVSVTISNVPTTITEDQFGINVSVTGASENTTNYLRINLFKGGTTDYFGFTYNGSDWYNGSTHTSYFPITVDGSGSWTGEVKGKLDTQTPDYKGPGEYHIKLRRYTASGTYIWSNEEIVNIAGPTPTQTPSPTLAPTTTIKPSPTDKPTATPKPTSTPKPTGTPKPEPSDTPKPQTVTSTIKPSVKLVPTRIVTGEVLSASDEPDINLAAVETTQESSPAAIEEASVLGASTNNTKVVFIGLGLLCISFGIIYAWKKSRQKGNPETSG